MSGSAQEVILYLDRDGLEVEARVIGTVYPRRRGSASEPPSWDVEDVSVLAPAGLRLTPAEEDEAVDLLRDASEDDGPEED